VLFLAIGEELYLHQTKPMSEEKERLNLSVKGPDFQKSFESIADKLLNEYCLDVNGVEYRMIEIEFYLNIEEHPDVFSHSDPLQKKQGIWYFHRKGKTYIENSFKGVDISLDSGGILIRSVEDSGGDVIEGPSKVLDMILEGMKHTKVHELASELQQESKLSVFNSKLCLRKSKGYSKYKMYGTPRVGLSLKKDFAFRVPYVMATYRFSGCYHKIKKNRVMVVLSLRYVHGITDINELQKISGGKKGIIEKYFETVDSLKSPKIKEGMKCSSVEELIKVFCYCHGQAMKNFSRDKKSEVKKSRLVIVKSLED
jgi:3-methyladenine DNA glycosylase Mpg